MTSNNLAGGHYLEPYAGGAGVALDLLFSGIASHIHINDADPAIYAFWISVTQHSDQLIDMLYGTPISMDQWHLCKDIITDKTSASIVEKGFATLFMNRTNRSGILKGGVIGGKDQKGNYKLDARFKKDVIANRIIRIKEHKNNITVYGEDAYSLLLKCKQFLPSDSLIYLDPPYYIKGQGLYRNFYTHEDHLQLANLIQNESFPYSWIVSYDDVSEIKNMYSASKSLSYALSYTAQKRYFGEEIMFFSRNLEVVNQPSVHALIAA